MDELTLLFPGLSTSRFYTVSGNQFLYLIKVVHVGGNSSGDGSALPYFYQAPIITPLREYEGSILALPVNFRPHLQRTLISMPLECKGLNIYIPFNCVVDIFASYIP